MASTPTRNSFLSACLQALNAADIPFCISRNHHEFWEDGPSDVDMIVSPGRLEEVVLGITSAACRTGYRLVARTLFDNLCLVFHAPGAGYVRLDLDTAVRWQTRTLLAAEVVLESRIPQDGLPIPSPHHEALILLCQCAWSGKAKPAYRERLATLNNTDTRVSGFLESQFQFDSESLTRLIAGESAEHLRMCFRRARQPQDRIGNSLALIGRSLRRIYSPPGIVICCPQLQDQLRTTTAAKLELLFPTAKAARGNDSIIQILRAVFRGGVVWADCPNRSSGIKIARAWVGKQRSFQWADGQIQHSASGRCAAAESAADFIGVMLAEGSHC